MSNDIRATRRDRGVSWIWWLIAAIIAILIIWWIIEAATPEVETTAEVGEGATVSDITDNPSEYVGRSVTVSGEVNEIMGERSFTIGGEEFGGEELLVVSADQLPNVIDQQITEDEPIGENDLVQVTGTVRTFDVADFEEEVGVDLDNEMFADWEGRPAVVARNIDLTPRIGEVRQPGGQGAGPADQQVPVTLDMILDNPSEFYGQRVNVRGEVTDVIAPTAFTISRAGPPGDEILVAGTANTIPQNLEEGEMVRVSGMVEEVDIAEYESDIGVDWDDQLLSDWVGRPGIQASSVSRMQTQ